LSIPEAAVAVAVAVVVCLLLLVVRPQLQAPITWYNFSSFGLLQ
jgi:hypothetical protein